MKRARSVSSRWRQAAAKWNVWRQSGIKKKRENLGTSINTNAARREGIFSVCGWWWETDAKWHGIPRHIHKLRWVINLFRDMRLPQRAPFRRCTAFASFRSKCADWVLGDQYINVIKLEDDTSLKQTSSQKRKIFLMWNVLCDPHYLSQGAITTCCWLKPTSK